MKRPILILIAGCVLASAGCQPPPARLIPAAPLVASTPFVKFRVTRIAKSADGMIRINARGQVLFTDYVLDGRRHIRMLRPDTPEAASTIIPEIAVKDINDLGVVVGSAHTETEGAILQDDTRAELWRNGRPADFWITHGSENYAGTRINNHEDIAGYTFDDAPMNLDDDQNPNHYVSVDEHRAFVCISHHATDLGRGQICGLNDKGQALVCNPQANAAQESEDDPILDTFLWDKGKTTPITMPPGYLNPAAVAGINNSTQVIGTMTPAPDNSSNSAGRHGFIWQSGVVTDLGTLGGLNSEAIAINNKAQIVGMSDTITEDTEHKSKSHAFLWQKGHMYDLNDFISPKSKWHLYLAASINDKGQIVGRGNKGAFLLTPISGRPLK